MKFFETNPDPSARVALDTAIRVPIKAALEAEVVSVDEVVFLLTRLLPELTVYGIAMGHLAAAYDLATQRGEKPILTAEYCARLVERDA